MKLKRIVILLSLAALIILIPCRNKSVNSANGNEKEITKSQKWMLLKAGSVSLERILMLNSYKKTDLAALRGPLESGRQSPSSLKIRVPGKKTIQNCLRTLYLSLKCDTHRFQNRNSHHTIQA